MSPQQPPKPLDVSEAQQPLILVKAWPPHGGRAAARPLHRARCPQVPNFVADSWLAAMDAAEKDAEVELGRVALSQVRGAQGRSRRAPPPGAL